MKQNKRVEKVQYGWKCPTCGLGNGPMALKCYHCPIEKFTVKNEVDFKNRSLE